MKDPFGLTDEEIADYFARNPEKDDASANEILVEKETPYTENYFKKLTYYGSVFCYGNPNKPVKIIF